MNIIGLDGKEYEWKAKGSDALENKSALHNKVRHFLRELFPYDIIIEEVELIGSRDWKKKRPLTADFYIPNRNLIVEAHGEQHYTYSSFFYKSKLDFLKSQKRDTDKIRWCNQNNINIIVFKHSDKEEIWREQIESR
jgi:hypothetical protein